MSRGQEVPAIGVCHMKNNRSVEEREFSINEIIDGIRKGEFFLVGQPQVNLATSELFGFEFLARWQHESYG